MVYFKEFNFEPSATGLQNTTAPNLPPPQQANVESGTNERTPLDGSQEPDTSFSSSKPEILETESVHPSYAGVHEIEKGPGPMIINSDVGSTGLNERPSFGNSEIDRKLNSLEPVSSNTEGVPLYEGSNINSMNFRPHNLGSEHGNTDARPSYESSNPTELNARPGIDSSSAKETSSYERQEEKDARLEAFAKLPMSDEVPTKIQEPPGLSYVLPMNDKVPAEKPLQSPIKLPPAIALITPKRGIKRIPYLFSA